jgi:hypothetical protein
VRETDRSQPTWRGGTAISALVLGFLGTALAGLGYAYAGAAFNLNEVFGPAVFWCGLVYFLLSVPFREAAGTFARSVRTSPGAAVFALYMTVHLLLYGFLFEGVLASIYGIGSFAAPAGLLVTTNLFAPLSLGSLVFDLAYNPIVLMTAPPVFSAALSFYSVAVAFVIAVLVVANMGRTRELGALRTATKKAKTFVVLPTMGIVLGASCCLSVAGLVSLATPATSILTSSPWIYYVTYFLFPCIAVVVLYLNLRAMKSFQARA